MFRNKPDALRKTAMLVRATFPPPDARPPAPMAPDPFAAASVEALEVFADLYDGGIINDRIFRHLASRIERIHDLVVIGLDEPHLDRDTASEVTSGDRPDHRTEQVVSHP
ncbi:MAG: hypothetical protein QOF58_1950 [Pseudonocardiales bacterium]|jgi:hypothetical protein|nr:hypothetical protein [Pseudonocardiales bacterium]